MTEIIILLAGGTVGAAVMYGYMRGVRKAIQHEQRVACRVIANERDEKAQLRKQLANTTMQTERLRATCAINRAYSDGIAFGRERALEERNEHDYISIAK